MYLDYPQKKINFSSFFLNVDTKFESLCYSHSLLTAVNYLGRCSAASLCF